MRRGLATALVAAALALLTGCGASGGGAGSTGGGATVFAAASLTEAFRATDPAATFNFAGSDQLAFQIEQGAPADVFASASPKYAEKLHDEGLVLAPRVFATNRVVVIVPRATPAGIRTIRDLARPGVKLVVGDPEVPIGAYTRKALAALGLEDALGNVVSQEQDVRRSSPRSPSGRRTPGSSIAPTSGPWRTR
jgi:molybdate transport system substrate-binding protein